MSSGTGSVLLDKVLLRVVLGPDAVDAEAFFVCQLLQFLPQGVFTVPGEGTEVEGNLYLLECIRTVIPSDDGVEQPSVEDATSLAIVICLSPRVPTFEVFLRKVHNHRLEK